MLDLKNHKQQVNLLSSGVASCMRMRDDPLETARKKKNEKQKKTRHRLVQVETKNVDYQVSQIQDDAQ